MTSRHVRAFSHFVLVSFLAIAALVGASLLAGPRVPATPSHLDIAGAMVRLAADIPGAYGDVGERTFCSGVHVGGGRVLTAAHCTDIGKRDIKIGSDDGKVLSNATVLWVSKHFDLALLRSYEFNESNVAAAHLRCDSDVKVGDEVHIAGNPMGLQWMHAWGRVAGPKAVPPGGEELWPVAMPLDVTGGPGDSGGPVFDMAGNVAGIVVAGFLVPFPLRAFMWMVPSSVACELTEPA